MAQESAHQESKSPQPHAYTPSNLSHSRLPSPYLAGGDLLDGGTSAMRASSSPSSTTRLIMTAIVALALLFTVLLAYAFFFGDSGDGDSTGAVSAAAARLAVVQPQPRAVRWAAFRKSWPEVVGMSSEAKKRICEEWTCENVHVIPDRSLVTMDHNLRRVRVFVDSNGKVARVEIG